MGKRYSKYVLFRVLVGAVYSSKFPENLADDLEARRRKEE